jgi:hypothetical protein
MSRQEDCEMNLMFKIIMDDSHWLDSFQGSILSREVNSNEAELATVDCCQHQAITIQNPSCSFPGESGDSADMQLNRKNSNQHRGESMETVSGRGLRRSKSTVSLDASYHFQPRIITAPMTVVAQLPAPEFVSDNNSVIVAESMRMIATVGSMQRTRSLDRARLVAGEPWDPFSPSGTS